MSCFYPRVIVGHLICILAMTPAPLRSATLNASAATIDSVWAAARPGDTVKLRGVFGYAALQNKSSTPPITIDATNAVFTDTLKIANVSGLNIVGGHYGSVIKRSSNGGAIVVYGGENIAFSNPVVVSAFGERGINFTGTINPSVTSGSFSGLSSAVGFNAVSGGKLSGNKIIHSKSDGIDIFDSHNISATRNSCSLGDPADGAHPDCIQLWSVAGHAVQSDIYIGYNSATGPTQGFTSFDAAAGGGLRFTIEHNTVFTSYPQGIACYACVDSNISYNTLSTMPGSQYPTAVNVIGGENNTVTGNAIGNQPTGSPRTDALTLDGDMFLDNYEAALVNASSGLNVEYTANAVPEPTTWTMLIIGFIFVGLACRRQSLYKIRVPVDSRKSAYARLL